MELEEEEKIDQTTSVSSVRQVGEFKAEDDATDHSAVDFDGLKDPLNPQNWSFTRKWTIVILVSLMSLMVNLATIICAPASPQIVEYFHEKNPEYITLLVSAWEIGEVPGPLIIAPLSELYGRAPIYLLTSVLFVLFSVGGALSTSANMVIVFRALTGLAVASSALNPAIIGDLFIQEERGGAMAVMTFTSLIGVVLGPVVGGFASARLGWRWTFWVVAIASGFCTLGLAIFLKETYTHTILEKKTKSLRKATGNQNLVSKYHKDGSKTSIFAEAIIRPIKLFILSPVLIAISLYTDVLYGTLYTLLTTLTVMLEEQYHFSAESAGLSFIGVGIGMVMGTYLCKRMLDRYMKERAVKTGSKNRAEDRLPLVIIGGLIMPAGLFLYGWTSNFHVFWFAPLVGSGMIGFALIAVSVSSITYVVDLFGAYAASGVAALVVTKNISGAVFPLLGPPLYERLGYGWGSSVLAFVIIAILPIPVLIFIYGQRLRKGSRFTAEI